MLSLLNVEFFLCFSFYFMCFVICDLLFYLNKLLLNIQEFFFTIEYMLFALTKAKMIDKNKMKKDKNAFFYLFFNIYLFIYFNN